MCINDSWGDLKKGKGGGDWWGGRFCYMRYGERFCEVKAYWKNGQVVWLGFTLVEIMIVVVIVGMLAAIVVPQFTHATEDAKDGALRMNIYRVRQQLEVYKHHHRGYPSLANFEGQMLKGTNEAGDVGEIGGVNFKYGPYMMEVPKNSYTNGNVVSGGTVGSSDWYYNEKTGQFCANDTDEHRGY